MKFGDATGLWRDGAQPARAPRYAPDLPERPLPEDPQVGPRYRSFNEIMADQEEGDQEDGS